MKNNPHMSSRSQGEKRKGSTKPQKNASKGAAPLDVKVKPVETEGASSCVCHNPCM